jgi:hypothetical protein
MVHPDDIDGLIGALQVHLSAGHVGFHGLYAQHQMDYRASYHQVCLLSAKWSNESTAAFDNRYVRELRGLLNDLGTTPAVDPAVYAVNTTLRGREVEVDRTRREEGIAA